MLLGQICYNAMAKRNSKNAIDRKMSRDYLLEVFGKSKKAIGIYTGEALIFSDNEFVEKFKEIIPQKIADYPDFTLTVVCGDKIFGHKNKTSGTIVSPFLTILEEFRDNYPKNIKVYYNYFDLVAQNENGYQHSIIVDGGEDIYIEAPHDYELIGNKDKYDILPGMILEKAYSLGEELSLKYENYIDILGNGVNDFEAMKKNTHELNDFNKFNIEIQQEIQHLQKMEKLAEEEGLDFSFLE